MPKNHNKVVLDLEFNPVREESVRGAIHQEIIEIGAVMLNDTLKTIKSFRQYIKPQYNEIEPKISRLTGITSEMLNRSSSFNEVMYEFMDWIGDEPFSLYSWSDTDRVVMQREIDFKYPDDERYDMFFCHWIDLQKIYQRKMGFTHSMGLANALGTLKIYFEGTEHGALADAANTAEVMRIISDNEKMKEIKTSVITFNGNSVSGGFTLGSIPIKKRN